VVRFVPTIILPHSFPHSQLKRFQCSIFIQVCKEYQTSYFTLSFTCPLSQYYSLPNRTYFTAFIFLKCTFIVQREFAMIFHPWIYYSLIRLTPSITPHSPFPQSLLFKSFQCILLCLLPTQMQCISVLFTIILLISFPPPAPVLSNGTVFLKEWCVITPGTVVKSADSKGSATSPE
jgi:hypothetical protein